MQAKFFAILLSLVSLSCGVYATTAVQPSKPITSESSAGAKINLNHADVSELVHSFKGIGEKRAEAIVKYREAHHGFNAVEDLALVSGIGKTFVAGHLKALQETYTIE